MENDGLFQASVEDWGNSSQRRLEVRVDVDYWSQRPAGHHRVCIGFSPKDAPASAGELVLNWDNGSSNSHSLMPRLNWDHEPMTLVPNSHQSRAEGTRAMAQDSRLIGFSRDSQDFGAQSR